MILCNKDCYPCCDFCIYAQHRLIKCKRFNDKEHDNLVLDGSCCNEFHCTLAEWPDFWVLISLEDWKEITEEK